MSKLVRSGLVAAGLVFLNMVAAASADAQGPLREVLKRMEMNYQGLTSLKANVTMDKFTSQLGDHDISEGTVMYIPQKGRDAAFRVDWTRPAIESLSVVNKQYIIYRPKIGQAYQGTVNKAQNNATANSALAFINMSKAQLQANYDIKYVAQENVSGNIPTWHLQLIPKASTSYKNADLWVDVNGMPIQAKVTENNNDTTTILLSNLQRNATIKAADIPIKLPPGLKPIKS